MTEEPVPVREISPLRLFPWLRLLQGVGLANDPRKLILAVLGVTLTIAGWRALDRLFPGSESVTHGVYQLLGSPDRGLSRHAPEAALRRVAAPAVILVGPFLSVFGLRADAGTFLHAFLAAVWSAAVWGILGGAIARIAVVQAARTERVGAWTALRFALRRWIALIGGPLTPLLGVAVIAAPFLLFGLLYRLPAQLGTLIAGIMFIFPLLGGVLMTLILVGLAVGWPLMHVTVAAEAEDGFDALSRSYAYVHQRPASYAAYLALALGFGSIGLLFVDIFAGIVVHLTHWALSFSAPPSVLDQIFTTSSASGESAALAVHGLWLGLVSRFVVSWVFSYFFSAMSIIYLLLRREVDGAPWQEVAECPPPIGPATPTPDSASVGA